MNSEFKKRQKANRVAAEKAEKAVGRDETRAVQHSNEARSRSCHAYTEVVCHAHYHA